MNFIKIESGLFGKLVTLILFVVVMFAVSYIVGMVLAGIIYGGGMQGIAQALSNPSHTNIGMLKFLQAATSIGTFIIPSIIFFLLFFKQPSIEIGYSKKPDILVLGFIFVLIAASMPFINFLMEINQHLDLPDCLSDLETWMRNSENSASAITDLFLKTHSASDLLINIIVLALIPALGEELFFRGCLQNIFLGGKINKHVAIFLVGFIFSAFHLQFYGFLPRFALGVLFGYIYFWSGCIWHSIVAHFVNNLFAVLGIFLIYNGVLPQGFDSYGNTWSAWHAILISLLVCAWLTWQIRRKLIIKE